MLAHYALPILVWLWGIDPTMVTAHLLLNPLPATGAPIGVILELTGIHTRMQEIMDAEGPGAVVEYVGNFINAERLNFNV